MVLRPEKQLKKNQPLVLEPKESQPPDLKDPTNSEKMELADQSIGDKILEAMMAMLLHLVDIKVYHLNNGMVCNLNNLLSVGL